VNTFLPVFSFKNQVCLLWANTHNKMKKRNTIVVAGLGLAQLVLLSTAAVSQTRDTTNLEQVVVTASRSPKKLADVGKIVNVITKEDIAKAQGRSLPELLNTVSGLIIAGSGSNPGGIQSVYLRGASSANTLILIDGIAVNDASGISGEYNIAAIDVSQIERIEILKGASSTLYGSDAVAGVINIITKKGEGKLAANALLSAGSYDTYKQVVGLNGQLNKTKVSLNFSNLSSKSISAAEPATPGIVFKKNGFKQIGFGLNLSQYVGDKITLTGGLQANQNKADLDNGAFSDAVGYTYDKTSLFANFGAKLSLTKGDLNLVLSQNNVKNQFDNNPTITKNKGNISNVEAIFNYQFNDVLGITSGANYKYNSTDQKYIDPNYPSSLNSNNHISSIYTSLFLKGGNLFRMELGGRYNNHSQYGNNFTYTINPSLVFNDQLKVYANISSAYRVPSLYQLYSDYGNINLKPETSNNYEIGVQASFLDNKLSFTTSIFKRNLKDVIDFGPKYSYINQNRQNDNGLEVQLGFKPSSKLNFNAFYNYVDGKVKISDSSPETFNLFRRPKNSFGANLGYAFTPKFYSSLNYRWNDHRLDQYYDPATFTAVSIDLKSYSKVDAYAQYQFKKMMLFADVKNILNAKYNDFAGYTTMGTNFNAGLSFNFN
jgi:vitamin B12 transporter